MYAQTARVDEKLAICILATHTKNGLLCITKSKFCPHVSFVFSVVMLILTPDVNRGFTRRQQRLCCVL